MYKSMAVNMGVYMAVNMALRMAGSMAGSMAVEVRIVSRETFILSLSYGMLMLVWLYAYHSSVAIRHQDYSCVVICKPQLS